MNSPVNAHVEDTVLVVILQLAIIVGASRLFGALFRKIGQPQVCGEVAAGLLLGPSFLGGIFPGVFRAVFDPSVSGIFSVLSQIGLVLMMFLIGMEFDFEHLAENRMTALSVSLVGIVIPFALGLGLGWHVNTELGLGGRWWNLGLFMGVAMSITAIPVLGRILIELGLNRTWIGAVTISAAAIEDAIGWVMLAAVTAVVRSTLEPGRMWLMVAAVVLFAAIVRLVVRPLFLRWIRADMKREGGEISLNGMAVILILVFLCAAATNKIGIFSIFGAFFLGSTLYDQHDFVAAVRRRVSDFVTVFFLPIFFTYTGLRTDIGTMQGAGLWLLCGLVLLTAIVGKLGGCALAARWNGLSWRDSMAIGVMMNTRGLMELIVINVGLDLGIIPKSVFFMLVLMAVVTTYMTAPLLRWMTPRQA